MKSFFLVVCLALLGTLAMAQVADRLRDSSSLRNRGGSKDMDAFNNVRVQLQGKLGESEDALDTTFSGYSTHVLTPDNIELSHCSGRITPGDNLDVNPISSQQFTEADRPKQPSQPPKQQGGKIFDAYSYFDKSNDETDLGTCWVIRSDESNAQLADWELSQQKCGQNQEGQVYVRRGSFTDAKQQQIDTVMAACVVQSKIAYISAEHSIAGKTALAMQARVARELPKPDISDRATLLEFAVPASCFTGSVKPFDIDELVQAVKGQDSLSSRRRQ